MCNSIEGYHITTILCICHNSKIVITCAKFHSSHFVTTWMSAEWNFYRIWIMLGKSFVEWAPCPCGCLVITVHNAKSSLCTASWCVILWLYSMVALALTTSRMLSKQKTDNSNHGTVGSIYNIKKQHILECFQFTLQSLPLKAMYSMYFVSSGSVVNFLLADASCNIMLHPTML